MRILSFCCGRSVRANPLVLAMLMTQAVFCNMASAGAANGQASATVIGEVISQPAVIFLQTPQVNDSTANVNNAPILGVAILGRPFITASRQAIAQSSPSRLLYLTYKSTFGQGVAYGLTGRGASSLRSLIDVDLNGVATFSVSSADSTSGYTVQLAVLNERTSPQAPGSDRNSLILPMQPLSGDGRLAVEVGRELFGLISTNMSVQISFN